MPVDIVTCRQRIGTFYFITFSSLTSTCLPDFDFLIFMLYLITGSLTIFQVVLSYIFKDLSLFFVQGINQQYPVQIISSVYVDTNPGPNTNRQNILSFVVEIGQFTCKRLFKNTYSRMLPGCSQF